MSPRIRSTVYFHDTSGDPASPAELLDRLGGQALPGLVVGGVVAARHRDPELDLHGTPRLDLSIHAPHGDPDPRFMEKLDPGLRRTTEAGIPIAVAVHAVHRAERMFSVNPDSKCELADPVETLLDLHELGLARQANETARRLARRTG